MFALFGKVEVNPEEEESEEADVTLATLRVGNAHNICERKRQAGVYNKPLWYGKTSTYL